MGTRTLPTGYTEEISAEVFEEEANREGLRRVSGIVGKVCELKASEGGNTFVAEMRVDHGRSSTVVGRIPTVMGEPSLYLPLSEAYPGARVDVLYWRSTGPRKGTRYILNKDTGRAFMSPILF